LKNSLYPHNHLKTDKLCLLDHLRLQIISLNHNIDREYHRRLFTVNTYSYTISILV
jgi:hypothetical protein